MTREYTQEIKDLENLIMINADAYYKGEPCISDDMFDHYTERLRQLYPQSEVLHKTGWGMTVVKGKQNHQYGMVEGISDKVRPNEVIKKMRLIGVGLYDKYTISTKLDGASVLLYYEDGCLVNAITRGDGFVGEGILSKMTRIAPTRIDQDFTGRIRGEFIISRENHKLFYPEAKSPRNTATGFLLRDEVTSEELDRFSLICYSVQCVDTPLTTLQQYEFLENNNFTCVPYIKSDDFKFDELDDKSKAEKLLNDLNNDVFDCDGLVINYGKGLVAVKWNTDGSETKVNDIVWEMSRLGKLTPVVHIEPVELSGATIRKVTGFNYEYVTQNKLGVGSIIKVVRSGDVIPLITAVCSPSADNKVPDKCPNCKTPLIVEGVNLICNNRECPAKGIETLLYFIHNVADVDGLGDTMLNSLLYHFGVRNIKQFITFCKTYEGFKLLRYCSITNGLGTSAFNKFTQLLESYKVPLDLCKVIVGLGLPNLAEKTVRRVLNKYDFDDLMLACAQKSLAVEGINYVAEETLYESYGYIKEIVELLPCIPFYTKMKQDIIYSRGICITGPLSVGRREFLDLCNEVGIVEAPINKADFLVTNTPDSGTTKNKKAQELKIPILSEREFREKYLNA